MMTTAAALTLAIAVAAWPKHRAAVRLAATARREHGQAAARRRAALIPGPPVVICAVTVLGALLAVGAGIGLTAGLGVVAGALARVLAGERRRRREAADASGWVTALDGVHADLLAGVPLGSALRAAAHGIDGAAARELGQTVALDALGGDLTARLRSSDHLPARRLGQAVHLAGSHGVPLAEIVRRAAEDVATAREHDVRADAALAGPRATALILTALPLLGIGMGQAMGARPLDTLSHGLLGGGLALAGAVFIAAGLLWTSRILAGART